MSTNLSFENWEFQTRLALVKEEINWDVADPLIEDAKLHWQASGQDPWSACGSPADFAAAAAAEQPLDRKAALDHSGLDARGYLTNMFFVLCVIVIPWSLLAASFGGSWSFTLTPARLVGSVLFTATFIVLLGLPRALRSSGRPRQAPLALVPIVILIGSTVAAFSYLPDTKLFTVPVLGLDLAAAVIALLQLGPSKPTQPVTEPEPMSDDDWFRKLDGLLVGRHDLPPARAAALIAETRAHLSSSTSAVEEFGAPEIYAVETAQQETVHEFPVWIQLDKAVIVLLYLYLNRNHLADRLGETQAWVNIAWVIAVPVLLLLGVAWALVSRSEKRKAS